MTKEQIKEVLEKHIAEQAGITEDRLSRILNYKSKMLATEMLSLAVVLGVDLNKYAESA